MDLALNNLIYEIVDMPKKQNHFLPFFTEQLHFNPQNDILMINH